MTIRSAKHWPGLCVVLAAVMLTATLRAAGIPQETPARSSDTPRSLAPERLGSLPQPLGPLPVKADPADEIDGSGVLIPRVATLPPMMQEENATGFVPPPAAPLLYSSPTALMTAGQNSSVPAAPASQRTHATPQLRVISQTPEEANIYHAGQFRFRVVNDGPIEARDVTLTIGIHGNGEVLSTFPANGVREQDSIRFAVGHLRVGQYRDFGFEFQPQEAGQIRVAPQVTSSSIVSVTTAVSAPRIEIVIDGEQEFLVGQKINQKVRLHNPGNDVVRNLVIRQTCSPAESLRDAGFEANRYIVPMLAPGQTAELNLHAMAAAPGNASVEITVEGDNVRGTRSRNISLTRNNLEIGLEGPQLTYINSTGTWSIDIHNDQPRDLEDLQVRLQLPIGMAVTVLDRQAEFNARESTITWHLPRLTAGQTETIPFKATISQFGNHALEATVQDMAGTIDTATMSTRALGRADIELKVRTSPEPVETGATTSVTIHVHNRGTHQANDVRVELALPDCMQAAASRGVTVSEGMIRFDAFQLAAGQSRELSIPVRCRESGDQLIRATIYSSASSKPIAAENSMFFFSSQKTGVTAHISGGR